ncbi:MAG: ATP synthase F0 subunit B [Candidatus Margulisbacteria bacterium]|nr:ATP synthase F0 subunit B [Candidatus Margulisiibacteriota bacterium]
MFEFNSSLFFWTLINFLILLFLVHKFALPAFLKMVEESEARKQAALLELENNNKESQRILNEYREKLSQAQDEARQILALAHQERDEIKKTEMEKMHQEKQNLLVGIRNEIDLEKRRFILDMKSESVGLILSAAKKIIRREINAAEHERLIEEDIQEFDALLTR